MCGIFGISSDNNFKQKEFTRLAALSERRGRDSSGLLYFQNEEYSIDRADYRIGQLISNTNIENPSLMIGHTRLITDGQADNQPVIKDNLAIIHNGIMVNTKEYWKNSSLKREYQIDTEVILAIALEHIAESSPLENLHERIEEKCKGSFSCALIIKDQGKMLLLSNTGSLFTGVKNNCSYFASERHFLSSLDVSDISQLFGTKVIDIPESSNNFLITENNKNRVNLIPSFSDSAEEESKLIFPTPNLLRCSKCILPETMPFIKFDQNGECNYCSNYVLKNRPKPKQDLEKMLASYQETSGNKCIVPFSGGRDSSYMLHLIKNEFNMDPITMTYDWGMVTDLARRNISLMCSELNVENILIADNIEKKRRNIKLNLKAWLKKPDLGMINILMAGDKHFFRHIETIRKEADISLNIWGMNPLEVTHFKAGYLGFPPDFAMDQVFNTGLSGQMQYQLLRAKEMIKNPRYLNISLWDTLSGEYHRSVKKQVDFYNLFDFWLWDEEEVDNTLDTYSWERAVDTKSTWRIGDGTAAFYNYVYYTLGGFTEYDTFRSNQIREGQLSRDEALVLVEQENQPRYKNIKWYLDTLDMDFSSVINTINNAERYY